MYKILIVEDEVIAAEYLKDTLERQGWVVVDIVDNGVDAIRSVKKYSPNLVLMDIMINGPKSGCEVGIDIKKISDCSIVFTTAYSDDEMISYAMDIKADGYIMKPYNIKEVIATIYILSVKKGNVARNNFKVCRLIGDFHFNYETNLLYKNEQIVKLGPKALKLIRLLCSQRDTCVSYEELYKNIWDGNLNLKKLQMVVYRIREVCNTDFIENINGVGYQVKINHSFS